MFQSRITKKINTFNIAELAFGFQVSSSDAKCVASIALEVLASRAHVSVDRVNRVTRVTAVSERGDQEQHFEACRFRPWSEISSSSYDYWKRHRRDRSSGSQPRGYSTEGSYREMLRRTSHNWSLSTTWVHHGEIGRAELGASYQASGFALAAWGCPATIRNACSETRTSWARKATCISRSLRRAFATGSLP